MDGITTCYSILSLINRKLELVLCGCIAYPKGGSVNEFGENVKNNDLSLSDYLKIFYEGKIKLIIITFFFGLIGTLYAFISNEEWVTKVQILPVNYNKNIDTFNFVSLLKIGFDNDDTFVKKINQLQDPKYILSMFYDNFKGSKNKEDFFSSYHETIKISNNESEFKKLIKGISIDKDKDGVFSITSTNGTKQGASEILSSYSKYIDIKVNDIYFLDLRSIINLRLKYLNQSIKSNLILAKNIRNNDISATKMVEKIAESVNQIEPLNDFYTLHKNSDIALGTKGLKEKIIQLKNEKNMAVFNTNLVKLTNQYEYLSNVKSYKLTPLITHIIPDSLSINTNKIAPRKGIIIIMSLFIGLMLSLVVIIFQAKLTLEYKEKYKLL
ncbi:hypothetical protein GLP13_06185 [Photobacterium carnosum]|nr:hypothetical protein [Photobacterium carnosum]